METEMETEAPANNPTTPTPLNIWAFLGKKEGTKRIKVDLNTTDLTLNGLKEFVCRMIGNVKPNEIEVLHNGGILRTDEEVKRSNFSPLNVITVIKVKNSEDPPAELAAGSSHYANLKDQLPQISLALRTAFLNQNFLSTIMKLGESDMLENIMAIAPGLRDDPVGIAIIQDPQMILQFSADFESLKKLAVSKPWVVEAFNFITASIHQEQGQGPRRSISSNLLFQMMDDEEMEDDEGGAAGGAMASPGPSPRITREQLSSALTSLAARIGSGPVPSMGIGASPIGAPANPIGAPGGPSFFDLLGAASRAAGSSTMTPTTASNTVPPSALFGTPSPLNPNAAGGSVLTPEMVARAMSHAFQNLSPADREARFNQIREQIARIQSGGASSGNPSSISASAPPPPPSSASNPAAQGATGSNPYASQLSQMRDMGITDERLATLALRVSEGDVQTAVDLIFSGWTGEGADVELPDEE